MGEEQGRKRKGWRWEGWKVGMWEGGNVGRGEGGAHLERLAVINWFIRRDGLLGWCVWVCWIAKKVLFELTHTKKKTMESGIRTWDPQGVDKKTRVVEHRSCDLSCRRVSADSAW